MNKNTVIRGDVLSHGNGVVVTFEALAAKSIFRHWITFIGRQSVAKPEYRDLSSIQNAYNWAISRLANIQESFEGFVQRENGSHICLNYGMNTGIRARVFFKNNSGVLNCMVTTGSSDETRIILPLLELRCKKEFVSVQK